MLRVRSRTFVSCYEVSDVNFDVIDFINKHIADPAYVRRSVIEKAFNIPCTCEVVVS